MPEELEKISLEEAIELSKDFIKDSEKLKYENASHPPELKKGENAGNFYALGITKPVMVLFHLDLRIIQ